MGFTLTWFWFWVILAAFMIVGEIFTMGFFLLPFGVGAAAAAFGSWMGASLVGQWIIFLLVSIPALLLIKRFADRATMHREPLQVASDRTLGKTGIVLEAIHPHGGMGRVRVGLEEWRAQPEAPVEIPEGTVVDVVRMDGNHLIVRPQVSSGDGEAEGGQL